jgi:hypothetical protein
MPRVRAESSSRGLPARSRPEEAGGLAVGRGADAVGSRSRHRSHLRHEHVAALVRHACRSSWAPTANGSPFCECLDASSFPVVCENSADDLCRLTVIELEQAADSLTTLHRTRDHRRLRRDELVAPTLVWPFFMISDCRLEMPFAKKAPFGPSTPTSPTRQTVRRMRSNWDSTQGEPEALRCYRVAGAERPRCTADRDRG